MTYEANVHIGITDLRISLQCKAACRYNRTAEDHMTSGIPKMSLCTCHHSDKAWSGKDGSLQKGMIKTCFKLNPSALTFKTL